MTTPNQNPTYPFFLDNVKFESETSSVTGAAIRSKLPADKAGYAIYQESKSNAEDTLVNDGDSFSLESEKIYFYSVPAATFGIQ